MGPKIKVWISFLRNDKINYICDLSEKKYCRNESKE
jgi:hypothetical protein